MHVFVVCGATTVSHLISPEASFRELSKQLTSKLPVGVTRHELWFQHGGRRCGEEQTLGNAGLKEDSFLQVHLRLRGGGGDGGATGAESRSSYLEMYMEKKPDKVDPAEERLARATTCKLSGQLLQPPCVVDELGSLYNKEAIVSALVSKSIPKGLSHISSLKHVRDVVLCKIKDSKKDSNVNFCCPISGQPLNGQYRFLALLPTGRVVSEKAVSQVPAAVEELVGGKYTEALPMNGSQEEVEGLWDKLIAKRAAAKKSKKEKKKSGAVGNGVVAVTSSSKQSGSDEALPAKPVEIVGAKRQDFTIQEVAVAKKIKATDLAPAHADKKVWASLFTSSHGPQAKETYSCRSTSARGWI